MDDGGSKRFIYRSWNDWLFLKSRGKKLGSGVSYGRLAAEDAATTLVLESVPFSLPGCWWVPLPDGSVL